MIFLDLLVLVSIIAIVTVVVWLVRGGSSDVPSPSRREKRLASRFQAEQLTRARRRESIANEALNDIYRLAADNRGVDTLFADSVIDIVNRAREQKEIEP